MTDPGKPWQRRKRDLREVSHRERGKEISSRAVYRGGITRGGVGLAGEEGWNIPRPCLLRVIRKPLSLDHPLPGGRASVWRLPVGSRAGEVSCLKPCEGITSLAVYRWGNPPSPVLRCSRKPDDARVSTGIPNEDGGSISYRPRPPRIRIGRGGWRSTQAGAQSHERRKRTPISGYFLLVSINNRLISEFCPGLKYWFDGLYCTL